MWARGRAEIRALGMSPEQWYAGWHQRIQLSDAVAFDSHAILGCDWEAEGVIATAFQASESFETPGVGSRVTKEIRRAIPRLMTERGARLCFVYSLCTHPEAAKWFRLLGFAEDKYKGDRYGPYTMRRFRREA